MNSPRHPEAFSLGVRGSREVCGSNLDDRSARCFYFLRILAYLSLVLPGGARPDAVDAPAVSSNPAVVAEEDFAGFECFIRPRIISELRPPSVDRARTTICLRPCASPCGHKTPSLPSHRSIQVPLKELPAPLCTESLFTRGALQRLPPSSDVAGKHQIAIAIIAPRDKQTLALRSIAIAGIHRPPVSGWRT